VYGDFLNRSSSMILTTHSPHIVSVSPVKSLVALKRIGTIKESKASSTLKAGLTEQQLQDLERYINATRGEILFAKGVILVEGDAETHLIPMLLNTPEFTLDKWGVSVCSVQGTDFAPYVHLLGKKSINIPFVVVTDGDPSENDGTIYSLGLIRGKKLQSLILDEDEIAGAQEKLNGKSIEEQVEVLGEYGIFVGMNTLEIDLVKVGYQTEMIETIRELGAGQGRIEKFSTAITGGELTKEEIYEILRIIEAYGKGRFAQRLAQKITSDRCPPYIQKANECLKSVLEQ
ncbi:ATP-dependent endonuclease, partial [bacterium]|nr:ATP-dependent endonuclease [bacterium]